MHSVEKIRRSQNNRKSIDHLPVGYCKTKTMQYHSVTQVEVSDPRQILARAIWVAAMGEWGGGGGPK